MKSDSRPSRPELEIPNRRGRLRLDRDGYRELRMKVLERDGWKCQRCGRQDQLQIHHIVRRSQSGPDYEQNLIVLCAGCHRTLHATNMSDQLNLSGASDRPSVLNDDEC